MCFDCEEAIRNNIGYKIIYNCKACNKQISEIIDTYFNEIEQYIECPKTRKDNK
jgi:hypothetical protein